MSSASIPYVLFVLVAAPLYALSPPRLRLWWLLAVSLFFYGTFNWAFVFLLVGVIAASFLAGLSLERWPGRAQLWAWILVILSPLGFYKYVLVWWEDLRQAVMIPVGDLDFGAWGATLIPVGLSFFTFQCLGYVLDVSRRAVPAERDPLLFGTFVAFFPQLLAGPIERFHRLAAQLRVAARPAPDMVLDGLLMLAFGLFLKTCVGDRLATYVDAVYAAPAANASATAALGMYGFALQLYGDFFGYSMIALGTARLFGLRLTANFRQPFFARDISEFWQRWHITLTRWIGDYVYRPMASWAMQRKAWPRRAQEAATLLVTWVTMGVWHGAGWNFVAFGALQAGMVMIHNTLSHRLPGRWRRGKKPAWRQAAGALITFHLVVITFALIRADSLGDWVDLVGAFAAFTPGLLHPFDVFAYGAASLAVLAVVDVCARFAPHWRWWRGAVPRAVMIGMLLILVVLMGNDEGRAFIYFRF